MTKTVDPDGNYTSNSYDGYNRLTLAIEYDATSTSVDYQSYTYGRLRQRAGHPSPPTAPRVDEYNKLGS